MQNEKYDDHKSRKPMPYPPTCVTLNIMVSDGKFWTSSISTITQSPTRLRSIIKCNLLNLLHCQAKSLTHANQRPYHEHTAPHTFILYTHLSLIGKCKFLPRVLYLFHTNTYHLFYLRFIYLCS